MMNEDDKMVKIEKNSSKGVMCSDENHYPYGTGISVDDDLVDELELGKLAVGDVVEVKAYAFVDSKSEYANKDDSGKSIRLQFTSLKIEREEDDRAAQMYGDS